MATIKENIETLEGLLKEVNDHCMCARFDSRGDKYIVIYPAGYGWPAGIQCDKRLGKIEALKRILAAMEKKWEESMWWKTN